MGLALFVTWQDPSPSLFHKRDWPSRVLVEWACRTWLVGAAKLGKTSPAAIFFWALWRWPQCLIADGKCLGEVGVCLSDTVLQWQRGADRHPPPPLGYFYHTQGHSVGRGLVL